MSSEATSSPVSASTLAYLIRWPVLRLIWLKMTFSVSDVAGNRATGQVTSERRRKPFQLARGAMGYSETQQTTRRYHLDTRFQSERAGNLSTKLTGKGHLSGVARWQAIEPEHRPRLCVGFLLQPRARRCDYQRSEASWQRERAARSSKHRPKHAKRNQGRPCSRYSQSRSGLRYSFWAWSGLCFSVPSDSNGMHCGIAASR